LKEEKKEGKKRKEERSKEFKLSENQANMLNISPKLAEDNPSPKKEGSLRMHDIYLESDLAKT